MHTRPVIRRLAAAVVALFIAGVMAVNVVGDAQRDLSVEQGQDEIAGRFRN